MVARVLASCLVAAVAGCAGGGSKELALPPDRSFAVATSITPRTAAFGDPLTARARVLLDRDKIEVDSVRLLARFSPWRDRTTIERVDAGNLTALTFTIDLQCLTLSCVAFERERQERFGATIISVGGRVYELVWPEVTIVSRVPPRELLPESTGEEEQDWPPRWRAAVAVPEPSYRLSPRLLTWLLGCFGLLLIGASAAAGWRLWSRGRLAGRQEVSLLDRALALVRSARTDEERRAALEALALALEGERDQELAEPARALAWSERRPSETQAEELAELAKGTR